MRWPPVYAYLLVSRATASADIGVPLRVQSSGALSTERCARRSTRPGCRWCGWSASAAVLAAHCRGGELCAPVPRRASLDSEAGESRRPAARSGLGTRGARGRGGRARSPGRAPARTASSSAWGEVADDGGGGALGLDGQHAADGVHLVGCLQGGVAEQRVDGGQPVVAGGGAVALSGLQVRSRNAPTVTASEVGQVELGGRLAGLVVDVAEAAAAGCRGRTRSCAGRRPAGSSAGR